MAALAIGSFADIGPLNVVETDDGCWHEIQHQNRTFDSEEELRSYASEEVVDRLDNATLKTINGTLYQEAECIGGSSG